jgi:hypothetical protein
MPTTWNPARKLGWTAFLRAGPVKGRAEERVKGRAKGQGKGQV